MEFDAILEEFGAAVIRVDVRITRPMQTHALASLRRVFDRGGPDELRFLLRIFAETHPASPWALASHVIAGVAAVLSKVRARDERVLAAFDKVDLAALDRRVRKFAGVVSKGQAAAMLVALEAEDLLFEEGITRAGREGWLDRMDRIADRIRRWIRANRAEGESEASAVAAAAAELGIATADAQTAHALSRLSPEARMAAAARSLCRRPAAPILLAAAALPTPEEQVAAIEAYHIPRRRKRGDAAEASMPKRKPWR